jgi:DNA-binding response OmpR family regulator
MRLLFVEDDIKIVNFVVDGLKHAGFAVDHAGDGEAGLELLQTNTYDGAVVDIMLPRMDGLAMAVARAHKGTIEVESVPGRGTTCALCLPGGASHYCATLPSVNVGLGLR